MSIYTERKESGLCVRCGGARDDESVTCSGCRARVNSLRRPNAQGSYVRQLPASAWNLCCIAGGFHRSDCKETQR